MSTTASLDDRVSLAGLKVLVLGDDTRAFLAVVRSLGRAGAEVHAVASDMSSPGLTSRYLRCVHSLPPYSLSSHAWVQALSELIRVNRFDLVIPIGDRALIPLDVHRSDFAGYRLAIPNSEAMLFFDKAATRCLARQLSVPIAAGRVLDAATSAKEIIEGCGFPLALKPRRSYKADRPSMKQQVQILSSERDLLNALEELEEPSDWLVESLFVGEGVGVSVLADKGTVILAFQHRRIRESIATGSSIRVSEALDPELLAAAERMSHATALHGVAMFEFRKCRRTSRFVLLEVNARFWGSLPLAVSSGANFPAALAALLTHRAPSKATTNQAGVTQWHLSGELDRRTTGSPADRGRLRPLRIGVGILGLAPKFLWGRSCDSWSADDPAPWAAERRHLAEGLVRAIRRRVPFINGGRRRSRAAIHRAAAALRDGRRQVVIVCYGNICRSPFAEAALRRKAKARGYALDITSAGTVPLRNRASPNAAVTAARSFGLNIDKHRSRYIDAQTLRDAAAVVVFDEHNVDEIRRLGLHTCSNVLRASDLIGLNEISDPYGLSSAAFERIYTQIDSAMDALLGRLENAASFQGTAPRTSPPAEPIRPMLGLLQRSGGWRSKSDYGPFAASAVDLVIPETRQ